MRKIIIILSFIVCLPLALQAVDFDFRDSAFSGANNQQTFSTTVGGIGVSLGSVHWPFSTRTLSWSSTEGIGLNFDLDGFGPDGNSRIEQRLPETLTVSFDETVTITEIIIENLFGSPGGGEQGSYSFDNSSWTVFEQFSSGVSDLALSVSLVTDIIYFRGYPYLESGTSDFTLAQITTEGEVPIPEPATYLLLGSGLLVAGFSRKRRLVKQ